MEEKQFNFLNLSALGTFFWSSPADEGRAAAAAVRKSTSLPSFTPRQPFCYIASRSILRSIIRPSKQMFIDSFLTILVSASISILRNIASYFRPWLCDFILFGHDLLSNIFTVAFLSPRAVKSLERNWPSDIWSWWITPRISRSISSSLFLE